MGGRFVITSLQINLGPKPKNAYLFKDESPFGSRTPCLACMSSAGSGYALVNLRAAAQCRRPLRWGPAQVFFCLAAAFGWFRLAGLLACSLACLFACFQRFPGRARLPTASTNQRSAIWKVDSNRSPGRNQQQQLRVQRAWRPHSLRCSEHEPKECAGSLLRRGRVPNVAFESNMQQSYRCRGSGQPQKLRFPRFSRPHSFVHSERQPKERAGSRKEKERNQRSAQKRRKRKKQGRTGGPRESFSAENCALQVFGRCFRPHSFAPHSEHQPKECEDRPNGLAVTELQR